MRLRALPAAAFAVLALPVQPDPAGARPRYVYAGDAHFAPYDYLDEQGRPAGFDVELVRALARDAGVEIEIRLGPWDRARAALDAGTVDLLSLSHSPERALAYAWLGQTWTMHQCVLFPTGRARYPRGPGELSGETVAVQERTAVDELLSGLPVPRPTLLRAATQAEALQLLEQKRASAVGGNSLTLRIAAAHAGLPELVELPLQAVPYGLVTRRGREAEFEWVAPSLVRLREAGTVAALAERHLAVPHARWSWRDYAAVVGLSLGVALLVSAGAAAWNRSLQRQVRARTRELETAFQQREALSESLAASEERFARLAAASFEAIAITEKGLFVDGNEQLARMLGCELRTLIGRSPLEFVAPEHHERVAAHLQSGSDEPYEHVALRRDGSRFPVEIHARAITYQGRNARVTALRDVTERRQAEEALRASEKRYRSTVDFSPIGIYRVDVEGTILSANLAFARLLGYDDAGQVLGLSMARDVFADPEERARLRARYESAGQTPRLELRFKRRDGTHFWAEALAYVVKNAGGGPLYFEGFVQDIGARRAAEEALKASEEGYRLLFEGNPLPMLVYDLESLHFLAVNQAAVRQYGYSREKLLTLTVPDLALPGDQHMPHFLATRFEPRPDVVRVGLRKQLCEDGTVLDVDLTSLAITYAGRPARMMLATDVSAELRAEAERERLRAAIERAAQEWQRTVDAVDTCVMLVDRQARFKRVNRAARELLGRDYPEILERRIAELSSAEPWRSAMSLVAGLPATGPPVSAQASDADGGRTWDLTAYVAPADEHVDERVILVVRDITRLQTLQESLRRSETMSAMGSLVAGVAHEVRNPLFSISATVDALASELGGRVEYDEYAVLLRSQVARLTQLMRDLLDYGKPPLLRPVAVQPGEVLKRVLRACAVPAQQHGVELIEDPGGEPAELHADAVRLEQVLENLVQNAIQHSPRGTAVQVAVRAADGVVELSVRDQGPGLQAEDIPRLCEPFFSRRKGGTGLGLSIVQRIVEAHGGTLTAENGPAGGAVFTVRLPSGGGRPTGAPLG